MVMADHITGQQVKELRKKLRMTQAEMAKEFGYLVGIVRQIGRRKMTDFDPDGIRP